MTGAIVAFLLGLSCQPYIALAFEWWLTRPRRVTTAQANYYEFCKGCDLR